MGKKIKLIYQKFPWRDRSSQVGERELTYLDTKDLRNGFGNMYITLRRQKNRRFMKIWFLNYNVVVELKAKQKIFSNFSRGHRNKNEIVCKHKMIEVSSEIGIEPQD